MLDETVQSAILQLQSQLTGVIGQMKDMARRRTEANDPPALSRLAMQAAQLQAGIQVLNQLRADIVEAACRHGDLRGIDQGRSWATTRNRQSKGIGSGDLNIENWRIGIG